MNKQSNTFEESGGCRYMQSGWSQSGELSSVLGLTRRWYVTSGAPCLVNIPGVAGAVLQKGSTKKRPN